MGHSKLQDNKKEWTLRNQTNLLI